MKNHYSQLAAAVATNLSHQRHPVRSSSLETLFKIFAADLRYGGDDLRPWSAPYLEHLYGVTQDRTSSVRIALLSCSSNFYHPKLSLSNRSRILLYILVGLADSVESVQIKANDALSHVCSRFDTNPEKLIQESLTEILPLVYADLADWTALKRLRGVGVLNVVIKYCSIDLIPQLPTTLASLGRISHDDDASIRTSVANACKLLGENLDLKFSLNFIFSACGVCESNNPSTSNTSFVLPSNTPAATHSIFPTGVSIHTNDTPKEETKIATTSVLQIVNALSVLAGLVSTTKSNTAELCILLSHSDLCCHENANVRMHVFLVVQNLISLGRWSAEEEKSIFWILLQLNALAEDVSSATVV